MVVTESLYISSGLNTRADERGSLVGALVKKLDAPIATRFAISLAMPYIHGSDGSHLHSSSECCACEETDLDGFDGYSGVCKCQIGSDDGLRGPTYIYLQLGCPQPQSSCQSTRHTPPYVFQSLHTQTKACACRPTIQRTAPPHRTEVQEKYISFGFVWVPEG